MQPAYTHHLNGVLVIDKPRGPTSMSMVNLVRRRAGKIKTGHAGTLDPLATGVLVLGLGRMTKRLGELTGTDKKYSTVIDLSATTAGHDAESPREEVVIDHEPTLSEVERAVRKFKGEIMQSPPAFSAIWIDGKRSYAAARKGLAVHIEPRKVKVYDLTILSYEWPLVSIELECAKGFYVRALARDLGHELGVGGYCVEIRRTAVGPFTLEMAVQLESLPQCITMECLISPEEVDRLLYA